MSVIKVTRKTHRGNPDVTMYLDWDQYYKELMNRMGNSSDNWDYTVIESAAELEPLFDEDRLEEVKEESERMGYPVALVSEGDACQVRKHTQQAYHEFLQYYDSHDLGGFEIEEIDNDSYDPDDEPLNAREIAAEIVRRGYTQQQFAERIGVSLVELSTALNKSQAVLAKASDYLQKHTR